jgi:ribonuclease P protein component
MAKGRRLTGKAQFEAVYAHGRSRANDLLVMKALPNGLGADRYGFSVSKRVGKAVVRNRVKRLIRESVRLIPSQGGWDLVFIARSGAAAADYHELKAAVEDLLSQARLLSPGVVEAGAQKGEVA